MSQKPTKTNTTSAVEIKLINLRNKWVVLQQTLSLYLLPPVNPKKLTQLERANKLKLRIINEIIKDLNETIDDLDF